MAEEVRNRGGKLRLGTAASSIIARGGRATGVAISDGSIAEADAVLITTSFPIAADLLEGTLASAEVEKLRRVRYLANRCLVLELDRSLSDTYWLNVNDPTFPFVGVIEHTNFEPASSYGGRHIVYLSRYLAASDPGYHMDKEDYVEYALPHLQRMFPNFDRRWILAHHVWDADYAQPVTERNYSGYLPGHRTSLENVDIYTMAQIYPEDRGTNYAVREGRAAAAALDGRLSNRAA
jgi:protoporphyrinogen oxidase